MNTNLPHNKYESQINSSSDNQSTISENLDKNDSINELSFNEIQASIPSSSSQCLSLNTNCSTNLFSQNLNSNLNTSDDEIVELPEIKFPTMEPIVIRGDGNLTLFGLTNMFSTDFPTLLIGRISKEEFQTTINKINVLLRDHHNTNLRLMLFGCLCCCCSLGCSLLWPTLALSKRTRTSLEKLLAEENNRLYNKLGFNWNLAKENCHNNSAFMEYVILIEFLSKLQLYQPD